MDTNSVKKIILILEDKKAQYLKYKNWVENNLNNIEIIPSQEKWQELKGAIQTYFMQKVSETEKRNAENTIKQKLDYDISYLILDYELEKDRDRTCNARLFYDKFIKNKKSIQRILVISGLGGEDPQNFANNLKNQNNVVADFIRIPKRDGVNFSEEVQRKIKEVFGEIDEIIDV
jgi:hypothetical protein